MESKSKTKRRKSKKLAKKPVPKLASSRVSYFSWFGMKVLHNQVKLWQEQEIWAYFERLGLRDQEEIEIYNNAFKKF